MLDEPFHNSDPFDELGRAAKINTFVAFYMRFVSSAEQQKQF